MLSVSMAQMLVYSLGASAMVLALAFYHLKNLEKRYQTAYQSVNEVIRAKIKLLKIVFGAIEVTDEMKATFNEANRARQRAEAMLMPRYVREVAKAHREVDQLLSQLVADAKLQSGQEILTELTNYDSRLAEASRDYNRCVARFNAKLRWAPYRAMHAVFDFETPTPFRIGEG